LRKIKVNGERASVPVNVELLMQPIIDEIRQQQIVYNWDETGLFYRSMPGYTLAKRGEDDGAGSKADKVRITAMLSVNGDGTKRDVIFIGKSNTAKGTNPDFWKQHGIQYFSNKSAWMNASLFNRLVKDFDSTLERPTILILDNFSGHNIDPDLSLQHVISLYLPPNTTSTTQALDAGIIRHSKFFFASS
jgi:hypothetical protein